MPRDFKQFYTIGEVAAMLDVNETTLRYWEKEFPQIAPQKSAGNVRRYTKKDIEEVRVVHNLVKVRGLKIAAARQLLSRNKSGEVQTAEVITRLKALREALVEIREDIRTME